MKIILFALTLLGVSCTTSQLLDVGRLGVVVAGPSAVESYLDSNPEAEAAFEAVANSLEGEPVAIENEDQVYVTAAIIIARGVLEASGEEGDAILAASAIRSGLANWRLKQKSK